MSKVWISLVVALVVTAVAIVIVSRRHGAASYVQDISYPTRCINCGKTSRLTTAEMNTMASRGEASDPVQGQMRRFKCAACGQTNVIMDERGRYNGRQTQPETVR